ncbi:hypothetical protein LZC95_15680 [Pendulispora brunnea]|uniref:Uncharacterized protein n=1 Tax=Pendulispora brunnea TaxID=2905690 RepID=A0ABZ2KHW8_9BACT
MSNLRNTISSLANDFAQGVLGAIRRASLEEILDEPGRGGARRGRLPELAVSDEAEASDDGRAVRRGPGRPAGNGGRGRGGRLRRRSMDDLAELSDRIVELLESHPEGLRAEQIREALNVQAKELPRPLNDALSARRIGKKGQKRATTYFARGAGGGGAGGRRGAPKASASPGRPAKKARGAKRGRTPKAVAVSPANGAAATAAA